MQTVEVEVERTVEVTVEPLPEAPEGTLTMGLSTFPNALAMPLAAERNALSVSWSLYDSLVWVDDEGNVVPALAESWEISEDGTDSRGRCTWPEVNLPGRSSSPVGDPITAQRWEPWASPA